MKPIGDIPDRMVKGIRGVFFDIDDTFTTKGKIPPESFSALWSLKVAGMFAVPITGRPAGWCDHIARMWPVDGVVGENGALYFYMDNDSGKLEMRFYLKPDEIKERRERLLSIGDEILREVPGTAFASDQPYRLFDIAIDFTEDVPRLPHGEIQKICDIFASHGVTYKVSSIHVNGWFGDYDKLTMTKTFAREVLGVDLNTERDKYLFIGDSPNDEPMFEYFPLSVGVENIQNFKDRMKNLPKYVAKGEGGIGFACVSNVILSKKGIKFLGSSPM